MSTWQLTDPLRLVSRLPLYAAPRDRVDVARRATEPFSKFKENNFIST